MSYTQYPSTPVAAPPPARSAAVTTAGVLLIVESVMLAGIGALFFILAAVSAGDSTGGMEDLGIAIAAGLAIILVPIGLLGLILGWRVLRRGHIARVVAIVLAIILSALSALAAVSTATDDVAQQGPVVMSVALALWYALIALLLLTPSAGRDVAATRAAREVGVRHT